MWVICCLIIRLQEIWFYFCLGSRNILRFVTLECRERTKCWASWDVLADAWRLINAAVSDQLESDALTQWQTPPANNQTDGLPDWSGCWGLTWQRDDKREGSQAAVEEKRERKWPGENGGWWPVGKQVRTSWQPKWSERGSEMEKVAASRSKRSPGSLLLLHLLFVLVIFTLFPLPIRLLLFLLVILILLHFLFLRFLLLLLFPLTSLLLFHLCHPLLLLLRVLVKSRSVKFMRLDEKVFIIYIQTAQNSRETLRNRCTKSKLALRMQKNRLGFLLIVIESWIKC